MGGPSLAAKYSLLQCLGPDAELVSSILGIDPAVRAGICSTCNRGPIQPPGDINGLTAYLSGGHGNYSPSFS